MNESNPFFSSPDPDELRKMLQQMFGTQIPDELFNDAALNDLAKNANLPQDPNQLAMMFSQLNNMMNQAGKEAVNWDLARDVARRTSAGDTSIPGLPELPGSAGDPVATPSAKEKIASAARLASMWLSEHTELEVSLALPELYSRQLWVEKTLPQWQRIMEPAAEYTSKAISDAIAGQFKQMQAMNPGMFDGEADLGDNPMLKMMGSHLFGVQFGGAIGMLSRQVLGSMDLGLPLITGAAGVFISANIDDALQDSQVDETAARVFYAARELATATLYTQVPWLKEHMLGAIENYARGIRLDTQHMEEMAREIDLSQLEGMGAGIPEQLLVFKRTPQQQQALQEITTTLALIEGWVDLVVLRALEGKVPDLDKLRETVRRRRAEGYAGEQMLSDLVGIELRPRLIREAFDWWDSLTQLEGNAGREKVWGHPDLLPSAEVLSGTPQAPQQQNPDSPVFDSDFDAELKKLLQGDFEEKTDEEGGE